MTGQDKPGKSGAYADLTGSLSVDDRPLGLHGFQFPHYLFTRSCAAKYEVLLGSWDGYFP